MDITDYIKAAIIQIKSFTSKKAKTSEKNPRLMYPIHPDKSLHHVLIPFILNWNVRGKNNGNKNRKPQEIHL
jgi:hypothetical protein